MPDVSSADRFTVEEANGDNHEFPGEVTAFDFHGAVLEVTTDTATVWLKNWAKVEYRDR